MTNHVTFPKQQGARVVTQRYVDITNAEPLKVHKIPRGAAIKIYPSAAGTAAVYSTNTPRTNVDGSPLSDADDTVAEIEASTNASWDIWGAGAITDTEVQGTGVAVESAACVVTSGTWVMEISVGAEI